MKHRPITLESRAELPGLSQRTRAELVATQPLTVLEALKVRGVGRKTTKRLMQLRLHLDPEHVQSGGLMPALASRSQA